MTASSVLRFPRLAALTISATAMFLLAAAPQTPIHGEEKPARPAAADGAEAVLPAAWHGTWAGRCRNVTPAGEGPAFAMALRVAPTEGRAGDSLDWTITYGEGDRKQVRRYRLEREAAGGLVMDEGNGIRLDCRRVGDVLHSHFKVGDTLLSSRFELRGGKMLVEISAADAASPRKSRPEGAAAGPAVESYPLRSVQVGELSPADGPAGR